VDLDDDADDEDGDGLSALAPVVDPMAKAVEAVNQTAIVDAMHAAERKLPNPLLPVLPIAFLSRLNSLRSFLMRAACRLSSVPHGLPDMLLPSTSAVDILTRARKSRTSGRCYSYSLW
jgi:hypothetical protein